MPRNSTVLVHDLFGCGDTLVSPVDRAHDFTQIRAPLGWIIAYFLLVRDYTAKQCTTGLQSGSRRVDRELGGSYLRCEWGASGLS